MNWTKEEQEFLNGLAELSRKTGIIISGCGCCSSPYLIGIKEDPDLVDLGPEYAYRAGYAGEVSWEKEGDH